MIRHLFIFLSFITTTVMAQSPSFSFRTIGINQGLSQSCVIDIAFDSLGFAWFATQDGLNRYDGKEFLIFPKNFDDITTHTGSRLGKLIKGQKGALWLITSGGRLEKMDLHNHRFSSITTQTINCFYEDSRHNQWLGTDNKGIIFHPAGSADSSLHLSLPTLSIQQIMEDAQGAIWILTSKGLLVYNADTHTQKTFLTTPTPINCSSISQDKKGNYWLGTYGNGLYRLEKGDSLFRSTTLPADLIIETVTVDRNDRVWVGTYGKGLFLLDGEKTSHFLADKKDPFSLPYNDILCIREDPYGGIWIGTDGGGVAQYNVRFNNFSLLSRENVPAGMPIEQVRAITTDKRKGIWIGTSNNGLAYMDRSSGKFIAPVLPPYKKGISNYERVVSLFTDREGDCWVGTQGNGLLIMDGNTRATKQHFHPEGDYITRLPDHTVWCMLPDTGRLVWIGTRSGGLCLLDKYKGLLRTYDVVLPEKNIRALTHINDSIIGIGFERAGVSLLNKNTGRLLPALPPLQQDTFILKCLFYQYPHLWVGTQGKGLRIVDLMTHRLRTISEKEGLPNNTIYAILPDHYGNYWMSTNKGLCRYAPPGNFDNTNKTHFTIFTRADGLQSNEFNTGAYHEGRDGELFFGGINGLTIFHPTRLVLEGQQPDIVLTGIMVNNAPLQEDTIASYQKDLDLSHRQNSLSFNFSAIDFVAGAKTSYAYRLLPYQSDWIESGDRNYAAYTNLPPGAYTFQVRTIAPISKGEEKIMTLNIRIRPPFWRTWWFITLCSLTLMGLLYAFYRYRISQLLKVQQIRHRIATDLHDDIGSALTNISLLSELSRKSIGKDQDSTLYLDRISEEVQSSGQALDDIVWSINTNNDTLEQMIARMRRYAAEIFDGADIRYQFDTATPSLHRKLNMEQRRDCFLAFKEILNNIYKHARAHNVHIRLTQAPRHFSMEITDDGHGFDTTAVTHRNGLKNIRLRVEKWHGSAHIDSSPSGTTVRVHIPMA